MGCKGNHMKPALNRIAASALLAALCASPGLSATTTAVLTVTAAVADTCIIAATPGLAFGTIDSSTTTDETVAGVITVSCTTAKTGLSLDMGGSANASSGQRRMYDGVSAYLPYNIHSDSGHVTAVAIDGQFGPDFDVLAAVPQQFSVYGQIPSGSYSLGAYTDTITVTLNY